MTDQLAHSAWVSEAAYEESVFPLGNIAQIGFTGPWHRPFANATGTRFGVPVRSDHERRILAGAHGLSKGTELQSSAFYLPHQSRVRTNPAMHPSAVLR